MGETSFWWTRVRLWRRGNGTLRCEGQDGRIAGTLIQLSKASPISPTKSSVVSPAIFGSGICVRGKVLSLLLGFSNLSVPAKKDPSTSPSRHPRLDLWNLSCVSGRTHRHIPVAGGYRGAGSSPGQHRDHLILP